MPRPLHLTVYLIWVILMVTTREAIAQGNSDTNAHCASSGVMDVPTILNPDDYMGSTAQDATCRARCRLIPEALYSYSKLAVGSSPSECICTADEPRAIKVVDGTSLRRCSVPGLYNVARLRTSFAFLFTCPIVSLPAVVNSGQLVSLGRYPSLTACFVAAIGNQAVLVKVDQGIDTYDCYASPNRLNQNPGSPFASTGTCGPNPTNANPSRLYYYARFQSDASQGNTRRRRLQAEELIRKSWASSSPCPGGMTACTVKGVANGYECLDLRSELESCGGCINGEYVSSQTAGGQAFEAKDKGADCTLIQGVRLGGVTCENGQCVVSSCNPGRKISQDRKACPLIKLKEKIKR